MSSRLPPLAASQRGPKVPSIPSENSLPPLSHWSSRSRMPMARSSSPMRSSSPPRTPYSSREHDSYAYIHSSSPIVGHGFDLPPIQRHSEDPMGAWAFKQPPRLAVPLALPLKSAHRIDITETPFSQYDAYDLPPSSEMEVEDAGDDCAISLPEIDSETTSDSTPGHGSIYFSDSDDEDLGREGGDEDGMWSFGYSTLRSTCFRVSSERGQWRDDPLALGPAATANLTVRLRQSVPTPSRRASEAPSLTSSRPVSEPLPCTEAAEAVPPPPSNVDTELADADSDGKEEDDSGALSSASDPLSARPITPEPEPQQSLGYSSPLPPSSPMLSPMSGAVSSMSRSVSPLSLPPSSPALMPSEALCDMDEEDEGLNSVAKSLGSLDDSEDDDMHVDHDVDVEEEMEGVQVEVVAPSPRESPLSSRNTSPVPDSAPASISEPRKAVEPRHIAADAPASSTSAHVDDVSAPHTSKAKSKAQPPPVASGSNTRAGSPDENAVDVDGDVKGKAKAKPKTKTKTKSEKAKPGVDGQERSRAQDKGEKQKSKAQDKGKKARPSVDGKPLREQVGNSQRSDEEEVSLPVSRKVTATAESKKAAQTELKKSTKKQGKARSVEAGLKRKADSVDDEASDAPAPSKKRRQGKAEKAVEKAVVKAEEGESESEDDSDDDDALPQLTASAKTKRKPATSSKPTKAPSKRERAAQLFALESPRKTGDADLAPQEGDTEMQGMIIECMATSRASSMPVSLIVRSVLQVHPGLKGREGEGSEGKARTEREWRKVVGRVLVNGMGGRGSGVFGRVESSGKDDSDRPLEAQWFYVPEMDEDQERAAVIRSMMPRPGKRSVTKQYKQYYWRPLDKISRWDPDDAL